MPAKDRAQRRANRKKAEADKAAREQAKKDRQEEREKQFARVRDYFNRAYGRDETKLVAWQMICEHVGIPVEPSIAKCKKALQTTFINIHDFVEAMEEGEMVHIFPSISSLRAYSWENDRIFPLKQAKGSPVLRCLLRKMSGN